MGSGRMDVLSKPFPRTALVRVSGMTGVGDGVGSIGMTLRAGMVIDRYSYTPAFIAVGLLPVLSLMALLLLVGTICPPFHGEIVARKSRGAARAPY